MPWKALVRDDSGTIRSSSDARYQTRSFREDTLAGHDGRAPWCARRAGTPPAGRHPAPSGSDSQHSSAATAGQASACARDRRTGVEPHRGGRLSATLLSDAVGGARVPFLIGDDARRDMNPRSLGGSVRAYLRIPLFSVRTRVRRTRELLGRRQTCSRALRAWNPAPRGSFPRSRCGFPAARRSLPAGRVVAGAAARPAPRASGPMETRGDDPMDRAAAADTLRDRLMLCATAGHVPSAKAVRR